MLHSEKLCLSDPGKHRAVLAAHRLLWEINVFVALFSTVYFSEALTCVYRRLKRQVKKSDSAYFKVLLPDSTFVAPAATLTLLVIFFFVIDYYFCRIGRHASNFLTCLRSKNTKQPTLCVTGVPLGEPPVSFFVSAFSRAAAHVM